MYIIVELLGSIPHSNFLLWSLMVLLSYWLVWEMMHKEILNTGYALQIFTCHISVLLHDSPDVRSRLLLIFLSNRRQFPMFSLEIRQWERSYYIIIFIALRQAILQIAIQQYTLITARKVWL